MDFLLDFLLLVVVFWLGKKYQTWMFIADIYKDPDHYLELAQKVKETKIEIESGIESTSSNINEVEVRAEAVNGIIYCYDNATGEFLAQAESHLQALTQAAKRYPHKRFRINPKL